MPITLATATSSSSGHVTRLTSVGQVIAELTNTITVGHNLLQVATKSYKVIMHIGEIIGQKIDIPLMRHLSAGLLWTRSTAVAVAGLDRAIKSRPRVKAVAILTLWRFTEPTVGRRQHDMPCATYMPQQHVGDGAVNHAVPVNAVVRTVVRLTAKCVVQVDNVKAVI